jgi:hypothetical protein
MKKTICFPIRNQQPKFALAIRKELPSASLYPDEAVTGKSIKQQIM